jgi:hypothetical protein
VGRHCCCKKGARDERGEQKKDVPGRDRTGVSPMLQLVRPNH